MVKLKEALTLFRQHLLLFSLIILTVGVPTNAFIAFVQITSDGIDPMDSIRIAGWSHMILGPIWLGATAFALAAIKRGDSVSFRAAMARGLKVWGALFVARLLAGLLIGLGLLALVVPGLILAVRYALLDPVVVLEDLGPSGARRRSTHLTAGRRWQIFGASLLFFVAWLIFGIVIYLPLGFMESMFLEFVLDCVMDVGYGVLCVLIFLFYWDAVEEERRTSTVEPAEGVPALPVSSG